MTTIVNRTQEEKKVRVKHLKQKKISYLKKPLSQKQKTTKKFLRQKKYIYIYVCQILSKSSTAHKILNLRSTQRRSVSVILTELGSAIS